MQQEYLFNSGNLNELFGQRKDKLCREVDNCEANYLLNVSVDDYCHFLEDTYSLDAPVLKSNEIYVADHGETNLDVSKDGNRIIFDRSKPVYVKATYAVFAIPFQGDASLFRYATSPYLFRLPRGSIEGNEIHIRCTRTDNDTNALKAEFQEEVTVISQILQDMQQRVNVFNTELSHSIRQYVMLRRKRLLDGQGMIAALGFPIKKRDDLPSTYSAPSIKRKNPIHRPIATTEPYKPEPTLEMIEYEYILKIISDMVIVMERSPSAFVNMNEESIRTHILVNLNGHYEGQATGETFNYHGKTDILIQTEGRNIFIAECKFWTGAEGLRKTIDQLLGYTSWRDTKTAIIVLNRNKNLSAVLAQIPDVAKAHSNCKKQVEYKSETGFRFVFHHKDDRNRELILTILVLDVPVETA